MNVQFERFTSKHLDDALQLALAELQHERHFCPDLPYQDHTQQLTDMLLTLSDRPFGKAAVCKGKLMGYMLFAGPWNGFLGNIKGVFSPLGASAFSYQCEDRNKLASMLWANIAEDFVKQEVFGCALSRYAHDTETAKSFIFNGFGIRCSDAVRKLTDLDLPATSEVTFQELSRDQFYLVEDLQKGLHQHLAGAPVFFPAVPFDTWFQKWIKQKTMRIFTATSNNKIIGFISIDDDAETFITEHPLMKNICGAYFDKNERGKGIAQGLLGFICDILKKEGMTHLGVDCETMNPTALRFWNKYFIPYTYSYARRIDERIL